MSPNPALLTADERGALEHSILVRHRLEEQFENLEQQQNASTTAMWVFLATEALFFGAALLAFGVYYHMYTEAFERVSVKLEWTIGAVNTIVLLLSSLTIVLAVHYAKLGQSRRVMLYLGLTATLAFVFLAFKGFEYYLDFHKNLVPGWKFDSQEWLRDGLKPDQVQHVKLFLLFYWTLTLIHAVHVTIGIVAVLIIMALAAGGKFSQEYFAPVDVLALYWHFVDMVWIFLLPLLYLLGTHAQIGLRLK